MSSTEEENTCESQYNRAKDKIFDVLYSSQGLTPPSSSLLNSSPPVPMNEEQYRTLFYFLEEEITEVR